MRIAYALGVLLLAAGVARADGLALKVEEAAVPAGRYYVGKAMGERAFKAMANASTAGFLVMRGEMSQGLLATVSAWGTLHGYAFEAGCTGCERDRAEAPAAGVSWRDAALLANALSEANGLDPVYRDAAGQPIRAALPPSLIDHAVIEPTLSGFRLPTISEWQIAVRGADKGLADGTYGSETGPNALGLRDTAGPLAEWTASTMDLGEGAPAFYVCNALADGMRAFSHCDIHAAGWSEASVGVRFVRRAGR